MSAKTAKTAKNTWPVSLVSLAISRDYREIGSLQG